MRVNRKLMGLVTVAGLAFAAGRLTLPAGAGPVAAAQAGGDQPASETTARMEAMTRVGTPGKHHRHLDQMAGEWAAEFKMWMEPDAPPMVSRGTITREWILDGRYLKETVEAESDMGAFRGVGYIGYNNFDGQFEVAWMDSMSTAIQIETGTYHPDTKILHMRGSQRDPLTGRLMNSWGKLDMADPDRHVYTGHATDPAGHTYKAVEGVAERTR